MGNEVTPLFPFAPVLSPFRFDVPAGNRFSIFSFRLSSLSASRRLSAILQGATTYTTLGNQFSGTTKCPPFSVLPRHAAASMYPSKRGRISTFYFITSTNINWPIQLSFRESPLQRDPPLITPKMLFPIPVSYRFRNFCNERYLSLILVFHFTEKKFVAFHLFVVLVSTPLTEHWQRYVRILILLDDTIAFDSCIQSAYAVGLNFIRLISS